MLLAGLALVLFTFGRFDYLGWKGDHRDFRPHMLPGGATPGQRATIKYCLVVALLFLAQVLIGGALAHYRAEPGNFYGIDLAQYLPSNILRSWHLQLAIFWIATAYVTGGLLLAPSTNWVSALELDCSGSPADGNRLRTDLPEDKKSLRVYTETSFAKTKWDG